MQDQIRLFSYVSPAARSGVAGPRDDTQDDRRLPPLVYDLVVSSSLKIARFPFLNTAAGNRTKENT